MLVLSICANKYTRTTPRTSPTCKSLLLANNDLLSTGKFELHATKSLMCAHFILILAPLSQQHLLGGRACKLLLLQRSFAGSPDCKKSCTLRTGCKNLLTIHLLASWCTIHLRLSPKQLRFLCCLLNAPSTSAPPRSEHSLLQQSILKLRLQHSIDKMNIQLKGFCPWWLCLIN